MYFADVHCHILFGVDDGAASETEMYSMLDRAYESGVRLLCATPHCNPGMFKYSPEAELYAFERLTAYAKEKYPDMQLFRANEVFVYSDVPSSVAENGTGIYPDQNTVLVEFYPDRTARQIETTVKLLMQLGYTALIAHVERYTDLKKGNISELRELGAVISVNADSIVGVSGKRTQKTVMKLIALGLVDVITSDSHSKESFSSLAAAYDLLSKKFDSSWLYELFYENPKSILTLNG